jgi:Fe2+ or Zn2+ uptake regulation protein/predicted nucleotidyltransferase
MIDQLFGSKTRMKLLGLFLNNPTRSFYVREITREVDEQINSVRRELANLVEVGVVKSSTEENKVYYEADQGWKFYTQLREMFAADDKKADDTKVGAKIWAKKIANLGDVRVAIFAGKLVYGSDSPLDLLVAGDNISEVKFKNLAKSLEKDAGVSLRYSQLSFNDFYYRLSVRDAFVMDILKAKNEVVLDPQNIIREEFKKEEK